MTATTGMPVVRYAGDHVTGPATSARFLPDAPPEQTSLQDIRSRLSDLREQASQLAQRLTAAADRGSGAIPQPGATNGVDKRVSSGAVQEINDVISDVAAILNYAHEQANRIERIV